MKTVNISRAAIVGFFVFIALVILVVAIFTIGGQQKTFAKTFVVRSIFDDIGGLQEGNNVWLYGVKIGTVKKINFYGSNQVEVVMNIETSAQPHIRKDATTKISSDGFIGNKIIVISGGSSPLTVMDNDILGSQKAVSTDDLLATLQVSDQNVQQITGALKIIMDTLKDDKGTIGKLISDTSIATGLSVTIRNFETVSAESKHTIAQLDNFTSGLNKPGTLANKLITDTTIFADLVQTTGHLRDASLYISSFAENLRTGSEGLTKDNTPAGMLLNNEAFAANLQTLTKNLISSSQKLDDDLEAVQHNFLFKGYFRRLDKQRKKDSANSIIKNTSPNQ